MVHNLTNKVWKLPKSNVIYCFRDGLFVKACYVCLHLDIIRIGHDNISQHTVYLSIITMLDSQVSKQSKTRTTKPFPLSLGDCKISHAVWVRLMALFYLLSITATLANRRHLWARTCRRGLPALSSKCVQLPWAGENWLSSCVSEEHVLVLTHHIWYLWCKRGELVGWN